VRPHGLLPGRLYLSDSKLRFISSGEAPSRVAGAAGSPARAAR